jgi:hypothetical protein
MVAQRTVVDGITFASKREARRWVDLKLLEQSGAIRELKRQVRFPLYVSPTPDVAAVSTLPKGCTYVADFTYTDAASGRFVVEDAKGFRTREYLLKRRMVEAAYGFKIAEV